MRQLITHRSIRDFTDAPVSEETIARLLEAGARAPNAGGFQNYALIVIDDVCLMEKAGIEAPLAIVALADLHRTARWYAVREAPFHFDGPGSLAIAVWDAHIALHNIALAAEALGLGTCYIGDVLTWNVGALLAAPQHVAPAGLLILGHPAEDPAVRSRLPIEAVIHRNTYRDPSDEELRRWYAQKDAEFDDLEQSIQEQLAELGITNRAQELALDCYTPEMIAGMDEAVVHAVRSAGFRMESGRS